MTIKQAFENMVAACKALQMTFDQHKTIERSIETVWLELKDKMPNPETPPEPPQG